MAETRKLAAILAADGAGYSRLAAAVGEGGIADIEQNTGARYFELKLAGDPDAEAARLTRIGMALAKLAYDTRVTLDANEHYSDFASLKGLVDRLRNEAALESITSRLLYVEQPMPRDLTRAIPLGALSAFDFIIDEADDSYSAFPAARLLGYRGISSKSCKGFYKSIVNATRAAKRSESSDKFFITGEDLSCQAGLSVQQDVALGALLGTTHTERNGHHYVDGFGETPEEEANAFLGAHPDLYAHDDGRVRLAIHDGDLLYGIVGEAGLCDRYASAMADDVAASTTKSKNSLGAGCYDDTTSRRDHERCDRSHGAQPAFDTVDHRDS